jgi:NOL1/NOP2/sun family putative RNA methylase
MLAKDFFTNRYQELGWAYHPVEVRQAIRINAINNSKCSLINRLESKGIGLEKIPFLENGYWITKSKFSVGATPEYLLGMYSIQEAAAQIPATLFADIKGKTVLDACAAPGGKTVQLADIMENTGAIIVLDIDKQRLTALSNQLERCRVKNSIIYQMDARQASTLNVKFSRVLLDVPCSGNFATDKQWFHRRTIKDVQRNAALQREVLAEAANTIEDDGEIVYSTCSLEPEEDELNIDWAIKSFDLQTEKVRIAYGERGVTEVFGKKLDDSIENCVRIWPGETQGFFVCKLRRRLGR